MRILPPVCLLLAMLLSACVAESERASTVGAPLDAALVQPYAGYQSLSYQGLDNWLCHPDLAVADNICSADLRAVAVAADGVSTPLAFEPAAAPDVDCFYVYPTTSADPGANSDFSPDLQEVETTIAQAARYGATCRLFAPVYRQRTLTVLTLNTAVSQLAPFELGPEASENAYVDVLDAFRSYITQKNQGRGFILVGHSQGASLLRRLVAEEVETQPYLAQRLIAAHLIGSSIAVPKGADVGGVFKSTPVCRSAMQTGCVVAYSSYRQGDPQLSNPRFGVTNDPATEAICVHPAALTGGAAVVEPFIPFRLPPVFQLLLIPRGPGGPYADRAGNLTAAEPFYTMPGQLMAECIRNAMGTHYLEIRISADPADARADDYPGEFIGGTGWGLHLADVSLAQGDLVRLAQSQTQAWLRRQR